MNRTFHEQTEQSCRQLFDIPLSGASRRELYFSVCHALRLRMEQLHRASMEAADRQEKKHVYYLSMEFLTGPSLKNALYQLGLTEEAETMLANLGTDLDSIAALEPDPGLGNGGLGRLAACYLDAAATRSLPFTGFSIKYEFGIFRQRIIDGWQVEFPDEWLEMGGIWLRMRREDAVEVRFGGQVSGCFRADGYHAVHRDYQSVMAIPYDLFVPGCGGEFCNVLTVWEAKSHANFDMAAFSRGEYVKALEEQTMAEVISKVLYPADDHIDGKRLRLRQQYLLVSASLQSILRDHLRKHNTLFTLPRFAAIHLNDTHPALAVPELMRLLLDEHRMNWEQAWGLTCSLITYTNHTVMHEAMERWDRGLYAELLPRIAQITEEINRRTWQQHLDYYGNDRAKLEYMAIICGNEVRMVNLCLSAAHAVNGVSALHTDILKSSIFRDYAVMEPGKFHNITNGIAYRRWLCLANPALAALLDEVIGTDYRKNADALAALFAFRDDEGVLDRLARVKQENKLALSRFISETSSQSIDPNALLMVQIKRMHEYKRQLLQVLQILHRYLSIKEGRMSDSQPITYLFAAKASPGYRMAKHILRLIAMTSKLLSSDPQVRDIIRVVFAEDYNVSLAQRIVPAAELSVQISLAGKEASGTGNMKMMMNGAVTIGTLDGANVEIFERVGQDNGFLFGLRAEEAERLRKNSYQPSNYLARSSDLQRVIAFLQRGFCGCKFDEILGSLLGSDAGIADPYMILADFDDYLRACSAAEHAYRDSRNFSRMSLINIAGSGVFSADRAIAEYERKIWGIE